ncbi:COG4223 family protein [Pseudosulfitobacter koreensis]|uniref:Mitochondrial inner membrane protein n=1 Tax=Pseudosulfitobacter koreensis TaxID=2968472 RepID=A0ABT1YX33_9RHOB|nr:hypothetical protein [Pseudosulfitobacter koreense]MCR8825436.1 hypothetical protein [Pseudosulfitobacter koreense]
MAKSKSPKPGGPTEDEDKVAVDVTDESAEASSDTPDVASDDSVVLAEPEVVKKQPETGEDITDNPQPEIETPESEVETAHIEPADQDKEPIADYVEPDTTSPDTVVEDTASDDTTYDHDTRVAPMPTPAPERRSGGFWPLFLGGIVAACFGFVAGKTQIMDPFMPPSWRTAVAPVETGASQEAIDQAVAGLRNEIEELRGQIPTAPQDSSEALSDLETTITDLETRISELEQRPEPSTITSTAPDVDISGLTDELAAQQAQIDQLLEDAETMQATATAAANTTLARAAASRVLAAVDSGSPFAAALSDVTANSDVEIPAVLDDVADDGVTTLSELQQTLPDAARSALAAARTNATDETGGFGGFLRRQLGARSVQPREGNDPDAVLSRVEDAVRQGRIADALAEADALPEPAKAEMQSWMNAAQARLEAMNAAEALFQRLAAN